MWRQWIGKISVCVVIVSLLVGCRTGELNSDDAGQSYEDATIDARSDARDATADARDADTRPEDASDASGPDADVRTDSSRPDDVSDTHADAAAGEVKIMPVGDSITLGTNGGYRNGLWNSLVARGYEVDYVGSLSDEWTQVPDRDHEGHSGWTIGHIDDEIEGWLAAYTPEYVLLMIGTNDTAWWSARNGSEIADAHAALVDKILASMADGWLLVASIPPQSSQNIEPNDVDRAELTKEYNASMEQRMQTRIDDGQRLVFVDIHPLLSVDDLSDGVHPNEEGYDIIAQAWFDALLPLLP